MHKSLIGVSALGFWGWFGLVGVTGCENAFQGCEERLICKGGEHAGGAAGAVGVSGKAGGPVGGAPGGGHTGGTASGAAGVAGRVGQAGVVNGGQNAGGTGNVGGTGNTGGTGNAGSAGSNNNAGTGADAGGAGSAGAPALSVVISSPAQKSYVRGNVNVQLVVTQGTPERLQLLALPKLSGLKKPLADLAFPYQFTWNTTTEVEGEYELSARASLRAQDFDSNLVTVVVDRTRPQLVARVPALGQANNLNIDSEIILTFSEALDPASVRQNSVILSSDAGQLVIKKSLLLEADGKVLRVRMERKQRFSRGVTLQLLDSIVDLAQNPLEPEKIDLEVPEWQTLGGFLNAVPSEDAGEPSAAFSPDKATLWVAWSERQDALPVEVKRTNVRAWDGKQWLVKAKGDDTASGNGIEPSLRFDANGPLLLQGEYPAGTALPEATVRRYTGTAWTLLDQSIDSGIGLTSSLALGNSGQIFVAAVRRTGPTSSSLLVHQWTGTAWQQLGGELMGSNTHLAFEPQISSSGGNLPYVAFTEENTQGSAVFRELKVKKWQSGNWVTVGDQLLNTHGGDAVGPEFTFLDADTPLLAWSEYRGNADAGTRELFVSLFKANAWQRLGGGLGKSSATNADDVALCAWNAAPLLAFAEDGKLQARWFSGSAWESLDGPINVDVSHYAHAPKILVDAANLPVIVFAERTGVDQDTNRQVVARRYNR